ncbi:MAG TPA: APC family permease [Baekduia sp.]|uniref:APC family permease n=1 Tax=Baekduia sp. TaxID=2600305 RepID=UPI002D77E273|nr:APC family permease [Baekduia sp.]HET6505881.1 APC family permease [Baekduia sp.]
MSAVSPTNDHSQELVRDFTLRSTLSLAFAFVSPIVALYGIFAIGLTTIGPGFWWGFLVTLGGQMLVALTFGQLASRWPYEGSVFQWSRRLLGETYGWFAGWAYIWVLCIAMAAVAYSGAGFLAQVVGIDTPSQTTLALLALGLLAFATWGNTHGRHVVKIMVAFCIGAEVIGSIGVGAWLLLFHREHGLGVMTDGLGSASTAGFMSTPVVLAIAYAGWSFLGFESAGAIAEEVRDPRRAVPKAMALSLLFVALVVMFSSLAIILAIPDLGAVASGQVADPVVGTLEAQLGHTATEVLLCVFLIGFLASLLAIQAAVSRIIWALAREDRLPAATFLRKLSGRDRLPVRAICVTFVMSGVLFLLSGTDIYTILVTFTSGGFYIAFSFPVIGLAVARARGTWRPAEDGFLSGTKGVVISWAALVWLVLETINIVWPRGGLPWYEDYAVFLVAGVIGIAGVVIRTRLPRTGADAPAEPHAEAAPALVAE